MHDNHFLNHNVFCICSLNSRGHETVSAETLSDFKRTIELHDSCFGLGKYCVAILNASLFIERCKSAIRRLKFKGNLGLVDYFNEYEFHGNMPGDKLGYQKRSIFSHQREYRVKIDLNRSEPGPYILDVGYLSDIAILTPPKEFNEQLEVKLPDNSNAQQSAFVGESSAERDVYFEGFMSASDYAAWYAAIVATIVLVWDVIKFRFSGPVITGEAKANWESYGIPETEGHSLTILKISNNGGRPTTINSWGMYWYPAGSNLKSAKGRRGFVIRGGLAGVGKIPSIIRPGEEWSGIMMEDEEFNRLFENGTILMAVGFSHSKKETFVKVVKS